MCKEVKSERKHLLEPAQFKKKGCTQLEHR